LDYDAIDNWTYLKPLQDEITISGDGEYFAYGIYNNLKYRLDSVIVQSTSNTWRAVLSPNSKPGFFSADSKQYIFQDEDVLCFLQTGTNERHYEKEVETYKVDGKKEWLAYQLKTKEVVLKNLKSRKEIHYPNITAYNFERNNNNWFTCQSGTDLMAYDLSSDKEQRFSAVKSYKFIKDGKYIFLNTGKSLEIVALFEGKKNFVWTFRDSVVLNSYSLNKNENCLLLNTSVGLEYVNLLNEDRASIWNTNNGGTIGSMVFDESGKQVAFVVADAFKGQQRGHNSIWYWKEGMDRAEMKVDDETNNITGNLLVQGITFISPNGRYIKFSLQPANIKISKSEKDAIQLDVWSYQDRMLQSTQSYLKEARKYSAILNLETGKVHREGAYERFGGINGDYTIIIKDVKAESGDRFWEKPYYTDSIWLLSLQGGQKQLLLSKANGNPFCGLSNDGKYLVYFNAEHQCNYFSIELSTGKLINISAGVPAWQLGYAWPYVRTSEKPSVGNDQKFWMDGRNELLVYDKYHDIWQLDPSGKKRAVCITNGYGRLYSIEFNLLLSPPNSSNDHGPFYGKDTLLLSAFNTKNKRHGFYRKVLGVMGDPELLSMDPVYMEILGNQFNDIYPLKASKSNTWVVNRQSDTGAPNYFVTHDFKKFKQCTFSNPHKNYNWLTTELHSFKQLDGTVSQGILYKPENFDPTKKYPVIISFYGDMSGQLNHFLPAQYIDAPKLFESPAWMVSHGYLVFLPDIYFIKGKWGPSTINTVEGAAQYLSQLSYVDGKHMGACGHSNSGRFGYYLLTHSNSFAAMSVGSGTTEVISYALSLDKKENKERSNLEWAEVNAYGTGLGELWQNKSSWLDQTSVLSADKVVSSLLQFHNKKDGAPFEHAVKMFTALRRLEKKVWLLQYDNGVHLVSGDDARDWTIRFTQFFDHYLKCAPAPRWMTQGIPYKLKGIEARYELDPSGTCGMQGKNSCNVCDAWNKQYKRTASMFEKEIKDWKLDDDIKKELDAKETKRHNDNMKGEAERIKINNQKLKGTWKGERY
jgi:dipeptidyl aminopeptidase/acylaminoacyl peptidase